jgi:hypothetical protein
MSEEEKEHKDPETRIEELEKQLSSLQEQISAFTMNMDLVLICKGCGNVCTKDTEGGTLIVDFREKLFSFICTKCKHDNKFSFDTWKDNTLKSPLPKSRMM